MQSLKNETEYQKFSLYMYSIIQVILFTIVFSIILVVDALQKYWVYMIAIGFLILLLNIVIQVKLHKNKLYKSYYALVSLKRKLDLPNSFIKNIVLIMPDGKSAYYVENKIIPESFIEFVEGKRAYLIKQLTEEFCVDKFKLIYVSQKKYALVEDLNRNRYLVHFDNLKAI